MFREMTRKKQQLEADECIDLLKRAPRGVLSVLGDDGYPYGLPINQYYCEEDGHLYFHGGRRGHRVDAVMHCDKASFCAMDEGFRREGDWALTINSVIVFGRIRIVEDRNKTLEISRRLSRKFTDDEAYIDEEVRRSGEATLLMELIPEHITGKRVHEA